MPDVNVRGLLVCKAALFCFISIAVAPLGVAAQPEYLRHETLTVRMDGTSARTLLPLDPSHQYLVILSSPYNLRPLLNPNRFCHYNYGDILCYPPLLFDGVQLETALVRDPPRGSYFLETEYPHHFVSELHFFYWGTGKQLTLKTETNLSADVPTATAEIIDLTVEQEERQRQWARQRKPLLSVAVGLLVGLLVWYRARNKRRKAQQQAIEEAGERLRMAQEKYARLLQEQAAREAEELKRQEALEATRHVEEAAARQAEEAAEEERHESLLRQLEEKYGLDAFAWREDAVMVQRYGQTCREKLLQERAGITEAFEHFHEDSAFIDYLKARRPDLYARADEVFRYRALASAVELEERERTPAGEQPQLPMPPKESRGAGVTSTRRGRGGASRLMRQFDLERNGG